MDVTYFFFEQADVTYLHLCFCVFYDILRNFGFYYVYFNHE